MFNVCETDFNFEKYLIPFLQNHAFFAELSRQLTKLPTKQIPTAAVTFDPKSDQVCMFYNPDFLATLSDNQIQGVITHEFYHLIFGHLYGRRREPHKMWNVATDLAINSLILESAARPRGENDARDVRTLPKFALVPGVMPELPDGRKASDDEKSGNTVAHLIASFPKMQASEWYFDRLQQFCEKQKKNGGAEPGDVFGDIDSMDDHDAWDSVTEEQRAYVEGKIKAIVEKAVRHADSESTGWGNIPAELQISIRKSVSHIIDWRAVFRQFIGKLLRGGRTTSIKRINRRYPYIHPGVKRGYMAKLLIARDESGSVGDEMLALFFSELNALTRKIEIDFIPFDCSARESDIVRWSRGSVPLKATMRTRGGGTDFNAPTRVYNDSKNRGRWDGLLIMTDGMAPAPIGVRGKRGWILAPGCKLEFPSQELQVFVTKERPMTGAWR